MKCWMLVGFIAMATVGVAKGQPIFYSLNVDPNGDDELVKVDAATGQVDVIGSLGPSVQLDFPVPFPSLAVLDGRLFVVNSTTAGDPSELLELDRTSGAVLSSTQIKLAGNPIPIVEGFDSYGGQLVISYGLTSGGGAGTRSNIIGNLALDGTISNSVTLSPLDDLDGLAVDSQGRYFGADASSPSVGSEIRSISLSPPATTLLATIGSTDTDIVDLAFTNTGLLFGLDVAGIDIGLPRRIYRIDPVTGNSLGSVPVDLSWHLRGLAFVPEPASLVLLCLAGLGALPLALAAAWLMGPFGPLFFTARWLPAGALPCYNFWLTAFAVEFCCMLAGQRSYWGLLPYALVAAGVLNHHWLLQYATVHGEHGAAL